MSDIQVGDLVVIAFDACCRNPRNGLGVVFRVVGFNPSCICPTCGTQLHARAFGGGKWLGYDVRRLKRIPPLSEPESERIEEKVLA